MPVNYQKLWNVLSNRRITRKELQEIACISASTQSLLENGQSVQIDVLIRICSALNCKLDDILDVSPLQPDDRPLPNIDISKFATSDQYATIGITKLSDFPFPQSSNSIKSELEKYCRCCKLSMKACVELVSNLNGVGITIDFPEEISPDIVAISDELSHCAKDTHGTEIMWQQLTNYVEWVLTHLGIPYDDLCGKAEGASNSKTTYLVELGYIETTNAGRNAKFKGTSVEQWSKKDVFPLNLFSVIRGERSYCIRRNQLGDLSKLVSDSLEALSSYEEHLIRLIYEYGVPRSKILQSLGLPALDILELYPFYDELLSRPVRKLCRSLVHTRKLRKMFLCESENPRNISEYYLEQYNNWVLDIIGSIQEALNQGVPIESALFIFYDENTVNSVVQKINEWKTVPDISIDDMGLSWKPYTALQHAGIRSLSQLWSVHGRQLSVKDTVNSGLNHVAGLKTEQISELLEKMTMYELLPINMSRVPDMVHEAEAFASGMEVTLPFSIKPSVACCGMSSRVLDIILKLKYRQLHQVLADYSAGVLESKYKKSFQDQPLWEEISATLQMFTSNQFPVVHYMSSNFWEQVLDNNPHFTLEDIRTAYLLNVPIKCDAQRLEDEIGDLFPTEPYSFTLISRTRLFDLKWIPWPISLFTKTVKEHILPSLHEVPISKAYYASDKSWDWIFVEVLQNSKREIFSFILDKGLHAVNMIAAPVKRTIFDAIEFCSEILCKTSVLDVSISQKFIKAQEDYCNFYSACAETESERKFFSEYQCISVPTMPQLKVKIPEKIYTLEEAELSVRACNCLKRAGITTLNEAARLSSEDLTKIRNMGKKVHDEVKHKIDLLLGPTVCDNQ